MYTNIEKSACKTLQNFRTFCAISMVQKEVEYVKTTPFGFLVAPNMQQSLYDNIFAVMPRAQA